MFFIPEFLSKESSKLREIVDKHFYDNWIVPVFMGYVVDLTNEWQVYDAAKVAIDNTVSVRAVTQFAEKLKQIAKKVAKKLLEDILPTGVLTNDSVLQKMDSLLSLLRDANTTCKWLMLHRMSNREDLKKVVMSYAKQNTILQLLLYTSQYELVLYKHLEELCEKRDEYWVKDKESARDNMSDISEYFSEKSSFKNRRANSDYSEYFESLQKQIEDLSPDTGSGKVSRKIQKLIRALDDVEKYDQIENNIQIRQHIDDTKKKLKGMLKVLNLKKRLLSDVKRVTDCSYSFLILKDYIVQMQEVIQSDASSTLLLRATFMKLSSIMDAPMSRIIQLDMIHSEQQVENSSYSSNFRSVSNYYSTELMNFVKEVLQVVPRRVFELAGNSLVEALTPKIKSMPGEIDQEDLRDYALFDKRAKYGWYNE
jgi:WASH complex subunit strumpellin